jgi:DNA-binding beta-propeller fold protein YncE
LFVAPASSADANAATQLPPCEAGEETSIAVDPVGQHVFVSGGANSTCIVVLDFDGGIVGTITGEDGAAGMALDTSTHTLYVALSGITSDAISEIDTTTLTERDRFSTYPFYSPTYLVLAAGKLWFSVAPIEDPGLDIASVNTDGSGLTAESLFGTSGRLASGGANGHLLALGGTGADSRSTLAVYDVSNGSPSLVSSRSDYGPVPLYQPYLRDLAFDPSGAHLLVASLGGVDSLSTSALAQSIRYGNSASAAVATTSDGAYVAVGGPVGGQPPSLFVFKAGDATLVRRWQIGGVADRTLAFSPDASRLFAVVGDSFLVFTDPTAQEATTSTSLDAAAPAVTYGSSVTLNVQVKGTPSGTVDLYQKADGTSTMIGSQGIDSTGAASFTVRPSKNTSYWATLEEGDTYFPSTSSFITIGVMPELAIAARAERTNLPQLRSRGEKILIAARSKPETQTPLRFTVERMRGRNWRTVGSADIGTTRGVAVALFKTKVPGRYRAQASFHFSADYIHADSKWVHFKAPTRLR